MAKNSSRRGRGAAARTKSSNTQPTTVEADLSQVEGRGTEDALPEVELVVETDVNSLPQHEVDEQALVGLMNDWRKGRATRSLWNAIMDAYVAVFSVVVIAAMLVGSIVRAQQLASASSNADVRALLPLAALAGVLAATLAVARIFGPVVASAAEGFWLMDAPLSRRAMLRGRLGLALGLALVSGMAVGALVAALVGSPLLLVVLWALAGGLGAAGLTAFAGAEQGAERTWVVRLVEGLLGLVCLVSLLYVVAVAAGFMPNFINHEISIQVALGVLALGVVLLVVAGLVAYRRLDWIRRARLVSGGDLLSGVQGAAFALDFALMRDLLVEREAAERGRVRPTRGRGTGITALVMRDVQRLVRFPRPLIPFLASIIIPYAVLAIGLGRLVVPIAAVVLMVVMVPFFGALRVLTRSKGLARSMPFPTSKLRDASTVVPALLALVWGIAITPAYLGITGQGMLGRDVVETVIYALITAAAGLIAAIRWVGAKPPNYSGPMVSTGAGAMPPGLMFNLFRGFDMVALITLWLVLGLPTWISAVMAAICFVVLRMGGIDQEELAAMQEENRRQLEAARQGRGGSSDKKKVVTRGRR